MAEVGTTTLIDPVIVATRIGSEMFNAVRYGWDCTSHTDGNLSGGPSQIINGTIAQVQFVPTTGDTQPDNAFDVTMPESLGGVDVLQGKGTDVSQTPTTAANIRTPLTTDSGFVTLVQQSVSVSASGCGSANKFKVYLTVRP